MCYWYCLCLVVRLVSCTGMQFLGEYGHIGILYIRGEYLSERVSCCNSGSMLYYRRNYISQTDEVRARTEQNQQLRSQTRTPV